MTDALVFLTAALAALLLGKPMIGWLASIRARQTIYAYAPETHRAKEGTPTMGGLLIMLGVAVGLMAWAGLTREPLVPLLVIFAGAVWFALIGLLDDHWIRRWTGQRGLEWKQKLALQLIAGGVSVYVLWLAASGVAEPLLGSAEAGGAQLPLTPATFALGVFWLVGWVNAFNLTDGLDGLAAGLTALAMLGVYVIGTGQGSWIAYALMVAGGCVGYLWWNVYPARVFMGDTGSMFLGASFGLLTLRSLLDAPALQQWGAFAVVGLVFAVEILSVIVQLSSVKLRGGKRIFRATPIHHHFELLGWTEPTIVMRFWLAGAVAAASGVAISRW
jgi:phospho-N-acetylmuramoyl-pentapeptide-transferase